MCLPKELLELLAGYLPASEVVEWMRVNKWCYCLLSNDRVWQRRYKPEWIIPFDIESGDYWKHYSFLSTFSQLFESNNRLASLITIAQHYFDYKGSAVSIGFITKNQPVPIKEVTNHYEIAPDIRVNVSPFPSSFGCDVAIIIEHLPLNTTESCQVFRKSIVNNSRSTILPHTEIPSYLDKIQREGYVPVLSSDVPLSREMVTGYSSYFRWRE